MTYKDPSHPDYRALRADARHLTDAMIHQRAQDALRWAVSAENLENQGGNPSRSSQSYRDESCFWQGYLAKRLDGMTADEIDQAAEASDRA